MRILSSSLELKLLDTTETVALYEGYAATFGNVDRVNEYFVKNAFTGVKSSQIPLLWNHEMNEQIGAHTSIKEDDVGLFVKAEVNLGVSRGRDAAALLRAGHLKTMSVGYRVKEDSYDPEKRARVLKSVMLMEISLAPIPANEKAQVTRVKCFDGEIVSLKDFQHFLREVGGLSLSEAECVIAKGYGQLFKEKSFAKADLTPLQTSLRDLTLALKAAS